MPKKNDESETLVQDYTYTYEPQRKEPKMWCSRFAALSSVMFMLASGGAVAFILFLDGFLLTLWPKIFYMLICLCITLMVTGLVGIFTICTHFNKLLLFVFALFILGQMFIACLATHYVYTEGSHLEGIRGQWMDAVKDGGDAEKRLCNVQSIFKCKGWYNTCESSTTGTDAPTTAPPSQEEEDAQVMLLIEHMKRGDYSLSNTTAPTPAPNTTDAPDTPVPETPVPETAEPTPVPTFPPWDFHKTVGFCPVCAEAQEYTVPCYNAIHEKIEDAKPAVITVCALFCTLCLVALIVMFTAFKKATSQNMRSSYVSPSRYL